MPYTSRRHVLLGLLAAPFASAATWKEDFRRTLTSYLERHRRDNGGYAFASDSVAHITPTWGVIGSYHLLGVPVPDAARVARFAREVYPVPERRRTERPLWRLDFEQVQTLQWLGEPVDSFRSLAATWTAPAEFTPRYELGGNPVFSHQAMAVRVRQLVGLPATDAWRTYIASRRRPNGTFNHTPASDNTDGHLLNTLWGTLAAESLGMPQQPAANLQEWITACQHPSGGFTYAPKATLGAVDDLAYTWAALHLLARLQAQPPDRQAIVEWIASLQTDEGGFQDRPGGEPNPVATYYALDSLRLLGATTPPSTPRAARAKREPLPAGAQVFSMQYQAPGRGSPREAVQLAQSLGIHIWAAKNSPDGWLAEARRVAEEQRVPVVFTPGNEEYGTYVQVPGLGTYSHLVDVLAPPNGDFGAALPDPKNAHPWTRFRDTRVRALRAAGGSMNWQFNENEELTRVLLDEAATDGTYGSIATFHFGNENFLHSQPYLMRWLNRVPFLALQDAHAAESWWWGDQLAGFTTLFIAQEPSWRGWQQALARNHVLAVRHDRVSNWQTQYAGGTPAVREFIQAREGQWRWWDGQGRPARRPPAALTVLQPGMRFEAGVPATGSAVRLRLWSHNSTQGAPQEPQAELVSLAVDGREVAPQLVTEKADRYHLALVDGTGPHRATARVRVMATGRDVQLNAAWEA